MRYRIKTAVTLIRSHKIARRTFCGIGEANARATGRRRALLGVDYLRIALLRLDRLEQGVVRRPQHLSSLLLRSRLENDHHQHHYDHDHKESAQTRSQYYHKKTRLCWCWNCKKFKDFINALAFGKSRKMRVEGRKLQGDSISFDEANRVLGCYLLRIVTIQKPCKGK